MAEPTIEATDISYEIEGKVLVDSVSISVRPGEFVGIIGPNGAGKSTLLSMIGGRLRPSVGTVSLMGESVKGASPIELALRRSMLSRPMMSPVTYTVQTVVESGRNPYRRVSGNTRALDERAVESAMSITRVDHMAARAYGTLSSGEQARVQVARILAQDTPIALLDEPTASLDIAHTELVLSVLARGLTEDHTTICVLHDLNAAAHYADRLVLMSKGLVVADGSPAEVIDPNLLGSVYGIPMIVTEHPTRKSPLVLPSE
jgi:iron complex transport system ATP-binding protein